MKTPAYTKWFSYDPADASNKAVRSLPAARAGQTLAHKEVHIDKQPSDGETESISCAFSVPPMLGEDGRVRPTMVTASISLTVEDWGFATVSRPGILPSEAGKVITYGYDAQGRLSSASF